MDGLGAGLLSGQRVSGVMLTTSLTMALKLFSACVPRVSYLLCLCVLCRFRFTAEATFTKSNPTKPSLLFGFRFEP